MPHEASQLLVSLFQTHYCLQKDCRGRFESPRPRAWYANLNNMDPVFSELAVGDQLTKPGLKKCAVHYQNGEHLLCQNRRGCSVQLAGVRVDCS
jgi:hypothetical protein